jgi:hypothetical protein
MNRYIFVSYSHQDQRIVSGIADRLERSGYSIWYDRDIQPGSLWDDTIKNRLKDSSVVLLFISSHFVRSDYCLLELKLALEQKKTIVPLYLDGAKFEEDLQRQIDRIQNIAISPTTYDECLRRLQKLDPIRKCLGKFSATPPGPDREYYSNGSVIDRVTFNSIKDHPAYGDEKYFLRVKLPGSDTFSPYASVKLRPGQTYEFELLIHNNATDAEKGGARSARITVHLPEYVRPSRRSEILAVLSSTNASPAQIWSGIEIHSEKTLFLNFVDASAVYHCSGACDGLKLSTSFIETDHGFYVGLDRFDGTVPAGALCRVTFQVRAAEESGEIGYSKRIQTDNGLPEGHVRLGELFTVRTEFRNLGTFDFRNVCLWETFPEGMELVPGTTVLRNGAHPDGLKMKDIIHKNGFNTGLYGSRANAIITYQAKFVSGSGKKVLSGHVAHESGRSNYYLPIFVEP